MANIANIAATIHADMCDDNSNGYSWSPRWGGDGARTKTLNIEGREYSYQTGSYDCSSSVITAWKLALQYTPYAGRLDGATYTGNMADVFAASGLFEIWDTNSTEAHRGDVYLNHANHTAMCQDGGSDGVYGYDALSEFCINEFGDVYGGATGDQTGTEAYIHGFYNYPWNVTLHYNGKADGSLEGNATSSQPAYTAPKGEVEQVHFRVRTNGKWLKEDRTGKRGSAITGIAINFNGHGWYQVKTQAHGWLEPVSGYDLNDHENGYAGYQDSPIVAVRAYYETPDPARTGYYSAKYRVSNIYKNWWDWQYDDDTWDGQDGYAGDEENAIDRFTIQLA